MSVIPRCINDNSFHAQTTFLPRGSPVGSCIYSFPGLNKNLWPLVHPGLSLKVDSSTQSRPLHLLKPFAEVLFRDMSTIRAVSLTLVLPYTQMAKVMYAIGQSHVSWILLRFREAAFLAL